MTYKAGQWNALCDVCGVKFKSSDLKKRWDGLMVCHKDFEHDHPQKYLRVNQRSDAVPWVRSQPTDVFVGPACDIVTSSAMADFGTADCAVADQSFPISFFIDLFYPGSRAIAAYAISGAAITGVT